MTIPEVGIMKIDWGKSGVMECLCSSDSLGSSRIKRTE
jgi:hypothetical protein